MSFFVNRFLGGKWFAKSNSILSNRKKVLLLISTLRSYMKNGGLKKVQYKELMEQRPEKAMELAVKRMLPDNTVGRKSFTRLHVYAGEEHPHAAQKPIAVD